MRNIFASIYNYLIYDKLAIDIQYDHYNKTLNCFNNVHKSSSITYGILPVIKNSEIKDIVFNYKSVINSSDKIKELMLCRRFKYKDINSNILHFEIEARNDLKYTKFLGWPGLSLINIKEKFELKNHLFNMDMSQNKLMFTVNSLIDGVFYTKYLIEMDLVSSDQVNINRFNQNRSFVVCTTPTRFKWRNAYLDMTINISLVVYNIYVYELDLSTGGINEQTIFENKRFTNRSMDDNENNNSENNNNNSNEYTHEECGEITIDMFINSAVKQKEDALRRTRQEGGIIQEGIFSNSDNDFNNNLEEVDMDTVTIPFYDLEERERVFFNIGGEEETDEEENINLSRNNAVINLREETPIEEEHQDYQEQLRNTERMHRQRLDDMERRTQERLDRSVERIRENEEQLRILTERRQAMERENAEREALIEEERNRRAQERNRLERIEEETLEEAELRRNNRSERERTISLRNSFTDSQFQLMEMDVVEEEPEELKESTNQETISSNTPECVNDTKNIPKKPIPFYMIVVYVVISTIGLVSVGIGGYLTYKHYKSTRDKSSNIEEKIKIKQEVCEPDDI